MTSHQAKKLLAHQLSVEIVRRLVSIRVSPLMLMPSSIRHAFVKKRFILWVHDNQNIVHLLDPKKTLRYACDRREFEQRG